MDNTFFKKVQVLCIALFWSDGGLDGDAWIVVNDDPTLSFFFVKDGTYRAKLVTLVCRLLGIPGYWQPGEVRRRMARPCRKDGKGIDVFTGEPCELHDPGEAWVLDRLLSLLYEKVENMAAWRTSISGSATIEVSKTEYGYNEERWWLEDVACGKRDYGAIPVEFRIYRPDARTDQLDVYDKADVSAMSVPVVQELTKHHRFVELSEDVWVTDPDGFSGRWEVRKFRIDETPVVIAQETRRAELLAKAERARWSRETWNCRRNMSVQFALMLRDATRDRIAKAEAEAAAGTRSPEAVEADMTEETKLLHKSMRRVFGMPEGVEAETLAACLQELPSAKTPYLALLAFLGDAPYGYDDDGQPVPPPMIGPKHVGWDSGVVVYDKELGQFRRRDESYAEELLSVLRHTGYDIQVDPDYDIDAMRADMVDTFGQVFVDEFALTGDLDAAAAKAGVTRADIEKLASFWI